jgi:predicted Zn-dependent protease
LGARLAARLPEPCVSYTFALTATDESNTLHEPLSLPGGYIFVHASLFLAAQDEAEIAGMLAHAMAHIGERHGTRAASRNQVSQIASNVPLIFYGGRAGYGTRQASTPIPVSFARLESTFVREADQMAVKLTSAAGYDPESLVRYMTRVWPDNPPDPERNARIGAVQIAIQQLAPSNQFDEFLRIQKQIRESTRN